VIDRELSSLPFDLYQRYRLVADIVERFPARDEPLRVLDIGGRTAVLREFLPEAIVTLVDVEVSEAPGLILGSGTALPFADRAFDVVTACDTLEHVPTELRDAFVREACRVSRGWVVLAGPYGSERVVEAEGLLRSFLLEKLGTEHRYLDEHGELGLPDLPDTVQELENAGALVATIGHACLERWLPLMCLSMYLDEDPQLRKVARRYYRFYNDTLYASDHAEPVYRHAVIASVNGVAPPAQEELLAPPVAPPGALQSFDQLVGELVAFDREQEVYQAERRRLTLVNEGLVADLDGHRLTIDELRTQLQTHAEGHEQVVEELQEQIEQFQEIIAELKGELDAHRDLIATQQDEITEWIAQQAYLEEEINRVNEVAIDLNEQLVLDSEEKELLRAELRNRFHCLRRAFAPKRPPDEDRVPRAG
jgi:hypothetical protein